MTMGPEPMSRMVEKSERLGIHHFPQSLIQRDGRRPAGRLPELGCVAHEMRDIPAPNQVRVGKRLRLYSDDFRDATKEPLQRNSLASPDVVDLPGSAAAQQG